jgi:hypothetical protein
MKADELTPEEREHILTGLDNMVQWSGFIGIHKNLETMTAALVASDEFETMSKIERGNMYGFTQELKKFFISAEAFYKNHQSKTTDKQEPKTTS